MDVRMRTRRDGGRDGGVGGVNEKIKGRCGRRDVGGGARSKDRKRARRTVVRRRDEEGRNTN